MDGDNSPIYLSIDANDLAKELDDLDYKETNEAKMGFSLDSPICNTIRHNIAISCYGDVYPCNSFPMKIGNCYDNALSEIWFNSEIRKNLINVTNKDLMICNVCQYRDFCLRCPGVAFSETGEYRSCAPQCKNTAIAYVKCYGVREQ